jgi:thiol-disulfide isomerase/thioredoxin
MPIVRLLILLIALSHQAFAGGDSRSRRCRSMSFKDFLAETSAWRNKELVAFASWCGSCKEKMQEARRHPTKYALVVAFDESEAAEKVLRNWDITAPCFSGKEIVEGLGIQSLPWTKVYGP